MHIIFELSKKTLQLHNNNMPYLVHVSYKQCEVTVHLMILCKGKHLY